MKLFKALLIFFLPFVVIICALDEKEDEETLSGIKYNWIDPHNMVDDTGWTGSGGIGGCRDKVHEIFFLFVQTKFSLRLE